MDSGSPAGDTDVTDTDTDAAACNGEFSSSGLQYDQIVAVCVTGESAVGAPSGFELEVPSSFGSYFAWPSWTDYDPSTEVFQLEVTHGTPGSALMNDPANDGDSWPWSHDPSCNDYDVMYYDFLITDGQYVGWTFLTPDCPFDIAAIAPPPLAPDGLVPSGPQACTPGEAEFHLAARRVLANDGHHASIWLTPVLASGAGFPERAWLREIEVVSWGDATNLHLADNLEPIENVGLTFVGGTLIQRPASGPTVVAYAEGAKPMSTLFGTEALPISGSTFDLPKVRLTWSCPSPASTHWTPVPGHSGHAATIPSEYGIDHRIVFWVANDASKVRIAPEGRYADYLESPLTTASNGGKTFRVYLGAYDTVFTGRLLKNGAVMQLVDAAVVYGGMPVNVPDQTLTRLD